MQFTLSFEKPEELKSIEALQKRLLHTARDDSADPAQLVQEREHLRQQYRAYMQQNGNHFASMTKKAASDNGFLHLTNLFAASDKNPQPGEPGIVVSIHPNYTKPVTHDHSFFELICVIRGSCSNVSGYQELTLQAGDILILAPGTKHAISVFDDDTFVMNILIDSATFEKTLLVNSAPDRLTRPVF